MKQPEFSFEDLKRKSIVIRSRMRLTNSRYYIGTYEPDFKSSEGFYYIHSDILAFVTNREMYVIPYHIHFVAILEDRGFKKNYINIPFTDGSYPSGQIARWQTLQNLVRTEKIFNQ